ncbi:GGDEF domain-containing protein [Vibrio algivorus]|uniref:Transporter substrate-binding domain-containing protein n=1 Tax=Vibrio algivorus TaxID=1667024 RepID=A0A557NX64_9VIBR|nr:GGDEF domain-containing protein [Vibrio algivorus]TVO33008.1 transporter substrate-binding domain-containing protein [Vibrio algivorus]
MLKLVIFIITLWLFTMPSYASVESINLRDSYKVGIRSGDKASKIIFDLLAEHFKFHPDYVYYDQFSDVLEDLRDSKIDFTANISYSKTRAQYLNLSRPTNVENTYLYTVPTAEEQIGLENIKVVGIAKNLIFKSYIKNLYPYIKIVEFSNYDEGIKLLRTGQVAGIVDSISKLDVFLNAGFDALTLNDKFPIQPVGLATSKIGEAELQAEMVNYLHQPKVQKQLRLKMEAYQLQARKEALRMHVKQMGIDPTQPITVKLESLIQLAEYQSNGQVKGVAADILKQSCEILALNCQIISTRDEEWDSMYQDLLNNKIDVLGPTTISSKRKKKMYFSSSYYTSEAIVVRRNSYKVGVYKRVSEMITEKISVIKDDYYDQLLSNMLPNTKLYRLNTREEQIEALKAGKVDYVIFNKQNYNKMLMTNVADLSTREDTTIGTFHYSRLAFAFPKTEQGHILSALFSRAMSLIDTSQVIKSYDINPDWRQVVEQQKKINTIILGVFIVSFLFISTIAWFIYRQSITDNLTKLKNRRALYQRYIRRIPKNTTFIYIDVDKFKVINDTYGHKTGDLVLRYLGQLIRENWSGHAYRIGGDEFVLIGKENIPQLQALMSRLQEFTVPVDRRTTLTVRASCGVSVSRDSLMTVDEAMHLADQKMYKEKAAVNVSMSNRMASMAKS